MYERAFYPRTERKPRFRFQNAREIHGLPFVEGEVFDLAAQAVASADVDRARIRNHFLVFNQDAADLPRELERESAFQNALSAKSSGRTIAKCL